MLSILKRKVISVCPGLFFSLLLISAKANAALPTVEDPTRGQGSGIFETMQNYAYDAAVFAGLLIAVAGFCTVSYYAIQVFAEVQKPGGKKTWGDFGLLIAIGIILLVAVIWLLTKAAEIL